MDDDEPVADQAGRNTMNGRVRMMKSILRIALFPILIMLRLMLGLAAFLTSIASTVLGLTVSVFALLSVVEFVIGYWQNGIAFAVLALLASPVGLPGLANLTIDGLDHLLGFLEGLLAAQSYR